MGYAVRWSVQVEAESPERAAQIAAEMQRDPQSTATVFEVVDEEDEDDPNVQWQSVEVPWP